MMDTFAKEQRNFFSSFSFSFKRVISTTCFVCFFKWPRVVVANTTCLSMSFKSKSTSGDEQKVKSQRSFVHKSSQLVPPSVRRFSNTPHWMSLPRHGATSPQSSQSAGGGGEVFLPELEGWLDKLGGVRKNWKTRYFVLDGKSLMYFKNKKDAPQKPISTISLDRNTAVIYVRDKVRPSDKAPGCGFALETQARTYLFAATSTTERDQWCVSIQQSLSMLYGLPRPINPVSVCVCVWPKTFC